MGKSAKSDNFLNAIKEYADEQQNAMRKEVEQLKEKRLKEAEIKGKADSRAYIKNKSREKNNQEIAKVVKIMQDGQKKLFIERSKMTEEIFEKASEKLIEFTKSEQYSQKLLNSTKAISDFFKSAPCVLYLKENDMKNADSIKAVYGENAEIQIDKSIKIGGIKVFCPSMGIVADETLDSKLLEQRDWFIENSDLRVL